MIKERLNRKQKRLMFNALRQYEYEIKSGYPWQPPINHRKSKVKWDFFDTFMAISVVTHAATTVAKPITPVQPQETKAAKRTRNVEEHARRLTNMATQKHNNSQ